MAVLYLALTGAATPSATDQKEPVA
jgi:hypothetical protein